MPRLIHSLVLLALFSCGCGDQRAWTKADSWYRQPPTTWYSRVGLEQNEFQVVVVNEAGALARLEDSPWVQLTQEEADRYLDGPFAGSGGKLILLRALRLDRSVSYRVEWVEGEVTVHHGCLGSGPRPMMRQALVARLPGLPSDVYVYCSMAQ